MKADEKYKEKRKEQRKHWHFDKNRANELRRKQYANNPEKYKKRSKKWQNNNKEYQKTYDESRRANKKIYYMNNKKNSRNKSYKRYYGITLEQYNQMFEKQGGRCNICGRHQSELNRALVVDHDHKTRKVRGLLCHKCNTGIGNLNDDIVLLLKAIEHLKTTINL